MGFLKEEPETADRSTGDHVGRSSVWLVAAALSANLLGFVFWLVAARRVPVGAVGVATVATATMNLAAVLTVSGVAQTLLRRLPGSGSERWTRIRRAYLWGLLAPCPLAFLIGVVGGPGTVDVTLLLTVVGSSVAGWCLVADAASVALRAAGQVTARNLLNGAVRTFLILLLAPFVTGAPLVLTTWVLALLAGSFLQYRGLRRELGRQQTVVADAESPVGGAVFWHHLTILGLQLPTLTLPVIVSRSLGDGAAGNFYIAWYIGAAVFMLAPQIANVVLAETSRRVVDVGAPLRRGLRVHAAIACAPIALLLLFGDVVLALFGDGYVASAPLLRLLALSSLPLAVNAFTASVLRHQDRFPRAALTTGTPAAATLLVALTLPVTGFGIVGVGVAWTTSHAVAALISLPVLLRAVRPVPVPVPDERTVA